MEGEDRELLRRLERLNTVTLPHAVAAMFVEAQDGELPAHRWLELGRELAELGRACLDRAEQIEPTVINMPASGDDEPSSHELCRRPPGEPPCCR